MIYRVRDLAAWAQDAAIDDETERLIRQLADPDPRPILARALAGEKRVEWEQTLLHEIRECARCALAFLNVLEALPPQYRPDTGAGAPPPGDAPCFQMTL